MKKIIERAIAKFRSFGKSNATPDFQPKDTKGELDVSYNQLQAILAKYPISEDGNRAHTDGYSTLGQDEADDYLNNYLTKLFCNVRLEVQNVLAEKQQTLTAKEALLQTEENTIKSNLDPKNEKGRLYQINFQITNAEELEREIEGIASPENGVQRLVRKKLRQFDEATTLSFENESDDELASALRRKLLFNYSKLLIDEVKDLLNEFNTFIKDHASPRNSQLHPPRRRYIIFFFLFCFVLLVGEIGFSFTVTSEMISPDVSSNGNNDVNNFLAVLYSIAMALSSGILLKVLIENLQQTKNFGKDSNLRINIIFGLVLAISWIVLQFLFTSNVDARDTMIMFGIPRLGFSFKGVTLSFFSITFALANAFMFREASYLQMNYFKINGEYSLEKLTKKKAEFVQKCEFRLNIIEAEKIIIQSTLENIEKLAQNISERINNLEQINITSFWKGYRKRLFELVENNDDLVISFYNKVNKLSKK